MHPLNVARGPAGRTQSRADTRARRGAGGAAAAGGALRGGPGGAGAWATTSLRYWSAVGRCSRRSLASFICSMKTGSSSRDLKHVGGCVAELG